MSERKLAAGKQTSLQSEFSNRDVARMGDEPQDVERIIVRADDLIG